MYNQLKTHPWLYLAVLAIACLQLGCKKKDVSPAQQLPMITSITPSSAIAGTPVSIKGINLANVVDVKFGSAEAANFDAGKNTDTAINVNVPDSLPLGSTYVQVYYKDGTGYSAIPFTVLLTPPVPKIDSVSPTIALPGAQIIISGTNFALVNSVKFGGVKADFAPALDTNGKIQATVPLNAGPGDQYITVTNPNGVDSVAFNVDFSPVINAFSPGKASEGDVITVSGVRFTGATSVKLGSVETSFTVVNDSTITFPVPTGALSGLITITTSYGSGTSSSNLVVSVAGYKLIIYDDVLQAGFGWWGGWGGSYDNTNTSPVESGTNSIKVDYEGGYGSPIQWGGANIDLTQYSTFKISIYGGPGSNGNKVNIVFDEDASHGKLVTLTEGQWTDYEIPLSEITPNSALTEIWLQEFSGDASEIIYVDNVGLN